MADVLPCKRTRLTRRKCVVDGCPVDGPGLGLHDPEVLTSPSTNEIIQHGVLWHVEMALSYVVVPTREIEIGCYSVVIPVVGPGEAANVRRNELRRGDKWSQGVDLIFLEAAPRGSDEVFVLEKKAWIAAVCRQRNL